MSSKKENGERTEYRCEFVQYLDEQVEEVKTRLARSGWTFRKFVEVVTSAGRLVYLLFERRLDQVINRRKLRRFKEEGLEKAPRYVPMQLPYREQDYLEWYLAR